MNADGDGCGSESALAQLLAARGAKVKIVNPTPWPGAFGFLLRDGFRDESAKGAAALDGLDAFVVLDISDVKRLGMLAERVRSLRVPRLVIDHHLPSDEPPGDIVVSDTTACATGELVYDVAQVLGLEITAPIAEAIYVAILTDTGSFRFGNTSPRALAVAADLLARGVDPEVMYQRVYASGTEARVRILGDALTTLGVDPEVGLAWLSLDADVLARHGGTSEDLDGAVEHARSIGGTRMALFFRDLGHGKVKVSFRSIAGTDVNAFARQFGGGGHARASGAMIPGTLEEVREQVVEAAREFLAGAGPQRTA
jgi:phosphoesterase RecJ-like protein